jgi:hypothetical protein
LVERVMVVAILHSLDTIQPAPIVMVGANMQ